MSIKPILAALWVLFVGRIRLDEMITGVGVIILSAAFLYVVWRTETLNMGLKLPDLAQGWPVPWYVVAHTCQILLVLAEDLVMNKGTGSFYRVSGFKTSNSDPRLVARCVLAAFYTTMAPNSIVIGIDSHQNRMLFHQLKRSGIPKMIAALDALSGSPSTMTMWLVAGAGVSACLIPCAEPAGTQLRLTVRHGTGTCTVLVTLRDVL